MNKITILAVIVTTFFGSFGYSQDKYQDFQNKKTEIFYDSFNSNKNNWSKVNNVPNNSRIEGGYFILNSRGSKGVKTVKRIEIDTDQDFEIETRFKITSISSRQRFLHSFTFGGSSNQRFFFGINGEGSYRISYYDNYQHYLIKNWTESKFIRKGDFNKLTVRKVKDLFFFFINEKPVYISKFKSFFGNMIGYSVGRQTEIQIDYLKVYHLGKKGRLYNSYKNSDKSFFINENFDTNDFNWKTDFSGNRGRIYIADGVYRLNNTLDKARIISKKFSKFVLERANKSNFEFEAKILRASGNNLEIASIIWGMNSKKLSFTSFGLGGNSFVVSSYKDNKYNDKARDMYSDSIESSGYNKLTVRRVEDYYYFFINEKLVYEMPFEKPTGFGIGFIIPPKSQILIGNLHFAYLD